MEALSWGVDAVFMTFSSRDFAFCTKIFVSL